MLSLMRRVLIRTLLPSSWSYSRNRIAASLKRFSYTESDSAWQFLRAAAVLTEPLLNALEEVNHAALFYEAASRYTERTLPLCASPRKALINQESELGDFLAYTYIGEHEVHREFETYSAVARNTEAHVVFEQIKEEEAGHEGTAYKMLVTRTDSRHELWLTLLRARLRRMYMDWIRLSETIGEALSWLWLTLFYYAIAPMFATSCRKYLAERDSTAQRSFQGSAEPALSTQLPD
jgi:hypothetical protein